MEENNCCITAEQMKESSQSNVCLIWKKLIAALLQSKWRKARPKPTYIISPHYLIHFYNNLYA